MRSIRQLETNTKIYAAVGLLFCLGGLMAAWLLVQLGDISELGARLGHKGGAALAGQLNLQLGTIRTWAVVYLAGELGFAVMLGLWLAAEIARPIHAAVLVARRVADGDLRVRADNEGVGESGQLMRAMREMTDKLVAMIVNVRSGTELIAGASDEIATGSMDLSARTEQQAASLEETASSMEELTATVKQNADHAHQASKLAISASEVAVKGGEVVAEVVGTMASINDSSKRIAEIIGVIDGIAFQTNILALNAAVEAARAGEQGRGFAVVASEVRSLAQRSAAAAKEIKALIDDSVEKVSAGTELADKAGNTMHEVVTSVKRVTDIISEIAAASAEQTAGIEQVNQAIAAMDQATQRNAALVEESAAAAATMREQAGGLGRVIGAFVLGSEHTAKPVAQVHLVASTARKAPPARAPAAARPAGVKPAPVTRPGLRATGAEPRKAPAPAASGAPRRAAVKPDVDWEEF
ncbi:MAG: methyl-accepting chemotaxis protein [Massilia sp.]